MANVTQFSLTGIPGNSHLGSLLSSLQVKRFSASFPNFPGQNRASIPRLNRDDFGVAAFVTIHAEGKAIEPPQSEQTKRKVRQYVTS